ncbi:MAG: heme o synthase [Bacteroidetes bacterium]|nr:heme o synthase [Bacteroidota bacterium]
MNEQETYVVKSKEVLNPTKLTDYIQFCKLRLSTLVVFSAVISYFTVNEAATDWNRVITLIIGGFLVTCSSNGFNQIIERDVDKLMTRTMNRPLPQGRMSVAEALVLACVMGVLGIFILTYFINPLSGILGLSALISYAAIYTPLKRVTPFAVFIGAFPGAIPPFLGSVAATDGFGTITFSAGVLFAIQFLWQFPHFWAIAWVMHDDYKKGGFHLLPSLAGRDKSSAFQNLVYTLCLIPVSLSPILFGMCGTIGGIIILIAGILFCYQSYILYKECTIKAAQQLMFGSFIYLPVVQLAILIG